jgi:hypothetical protein
MAHEHGVQGETASSLTSIEFFEGGDTVLGSYTFIITFSQNGLTQ